MTVKSLSISFTTFGPIGELRANFFAVETNPETLDVFPRTGTLVKNSHDRHATDSQQPVILVRIRETISPVTLKTMSWIHSLTYVPYFVLSATSSHERVNECVNEPPFHQASVNTTGSKFSTSLKPRL